MHCKALWTNLTVFVDNCYVLLLKPTRCYLQPCRKSVPHAVDKVIFLVKTVLESYGFNFIVMLEAVCVAQYWGVITLLSKLHFPVAVGFYRYRVPK